MDDDDLRRRLAATDLSSPGITLDEAVRRAARTARAPSWTLRLAVTAVVVWLAVFAAQTAVERSMNAVVPLAFSPVAREAAPSVFLQQRLLLAEPMWDDTWPRGEAGSSRTETRPAVPDSTEHHRSGSLPLRRWSHV
jgi:hypothetical protein